MEFTKGKDATSFGQADARGCKMESGRRTIWYSDANAASMHKTMLAPRAKKRIDQSLRSVESESLKGSFLQQPSSNSTTPSMPVQKAPVVGKDGKPCIGAVGQ